MLTEADIDVGDIVQVKVGAQDLTNGLHAYKGSAWYWEGDTFWGVVHAKEKNYKSQYTSWKPVTAILIYGPRDNPITPVWRVLPKDVAENIIKKNPKPKPKPKPEPPPEPEPEPEPPQPAPDINIDIFDHDTSGYDNPYAPPNGQEHWGSGEPTGPLKGDKTIGPDAPSSVGHEVHDLEFARRDITEIDGRWRRLNRREKSDIGNISGMWVDSSVISPYINKPWLRRSRDNRVNFTTAWDENYAVMLNDFQRDETGQITSGASDVQNEYGFPIQKSVSNKRTQKSAVYDYQVIPGDTRYDFGTTRDNRRPGLTSTLEDKLTEVRASFGIPVHGNNLIARAMKYYMYNRFKSPDPNLLHNKSVTYVFFTRPDLNILYTKDKPKLRANIQTLNHTEAALIWRRYPELFKLLTNHTRCADDNNFNMLLSNQVTSFDIKDEEIDIIEAGKSWGEYTMLYGDAYTGRNAGEFSCNFNETSDYSVINLMKLWVTYIDMVSRGAWSPSYNLDAGDGISTAGEDMSHVYTKTLDYAASCYVFKCGPDGEEVLYWTKYYGVFPVNTGASALTWDNDQPIGQTPKLNIRFKYAYKKDMSPISLLEFNHAANIQSEAGAANGEYIPSFDVAHNNSYRPFVGAPFIEISLSSPEFETNTVKIDQQLTQIRLKFKKYPTSLSADRAPAGAWYHDDKLYRSQYSSGRIDYTPGITKEEDLVIDTYETTRGIIQK